MTPPPSASSAMGMMPAAGDADALWADAWSVLVDSCATSGCHTGANAPGRLSLDPANEAAGRTTAEGQANSIARSVSSGSMPPRNATALTTEEKAAIAAWAASL